MQADEQSLQGELIVQDRAAVTVERSETVASDRKIIHIDMDAFFASVEQRDNPEYRGKPLIVGGQPHSRGVVAACSYEARVFGIHSAMPSSQAHRQCPQAIFVSPRFDAYRDASRLIQAIFQRYTDKVEPLSLDEAYLDVTDRARTEQRFAGSAQRIANEIRQVIFDELNLTASAGVSYNKFLAKLASDRNKPNGICVIKPGEAEALLALLPVRKFHGVGQATERKMNKLGIATGQDLKKWPQHELVDAFGKQGLYYFNIVRGIDHRSVNNNRERKSIGAERTFQNDLQNTHEMLAALELICDTLIERMKAKNAYAKTLTLKLRYANFEVVTRSISPSGGLSDKQSITRLLPALLTKTEAGERAVRLLGLSVAHLQRDASSAKAMGADDASAVEPAHVNREGSIEIQAVNAFYPSQLKLL